MIYHHAILLSAASFVTASSDSPDDWVNLTVYHTNQANYSAGDIADMNTADALGDLEFTVRAKLYPLECATPELKREAPYDCENPEQDADNLAITKLVVSVKKSALPGVYCPCNVHAGVYSCAAMHHGGGEPQPCPTGVGGETVGEFLGRYANMSNYNASTPNFKWYAGNILARFGAGIWYSTVGDAEGSVWKVAEVVKRVSRKCSDDVQVAAVTAADTAGCFKNCPQPTNRSSTCWTGCYFDTLLGSGSGASRVSNTAGIPINDVVAAWDHPFASDDPAHGGCPSF